MMQVTRRPSAFILQNVHVQRQRTPNLLRFTRPFRLRKIARERRPPPQVVACSAEADEPELTTSIGLPLKVSITPPNGDTIVVDHIPFIIGSSSEADIQISGPDVLEKHVEIGIQINRVTVKALGGEELDLKCDTHTILNGTPLRAQVDYLVTTKSELQIGSSDDVWIIEYPEQPYISAFNVMPLKSLVSTFSEEMQEFFSRTSGL